MGRWERKMRDYRQSLSVWPFTADWVWSVIKSSYLLPNQLSASNGIPSLIELSLLLPGDIYCNLMKIFFTVVSRKKLDSIKRGSVGNTRLLPHAEMLLVPMKFFLWRIDYALQEKVLTWKMCFLPLISFWERATHKFKSLGFVCSPSFFSLTAASRLSRVSLSLLSLRKMGTTRTLGNWGP